MGTGSGSSGNSEGSGNNGDKDNKDGDKNKPAWYKGENWEKDRAEANRAKAEVMQGKDRVRTIDRIDTDLREQWHVHFKDGSALFKNGVWKHGGRALSNAEKTFLKKFGWTLPK